MKLFLILAQTLTTAWIRDANSLIDWWLDNSFRVSIVIYFCHTFDYGQSEI